MSTAKGVLFHGRSDRHRQRWRRSNEIGDNMSTKTTTGHTVSRNVTRHADGSSTWPCERCGKTVTRYRGTGDTACECGAQYNAFGQRLRDDWRDNESNWDEDVSDLEGYERQHAGDE